MTKRLSWNYWQEEYSDGKLVIFDRPDSESDIRHEKYDLDVVRWCDNEFWDADQAALISFSRDPKKVENADSQPSPLIISDGDLQYEEHDELLKHVLKLRAAIIASQERQQLSEGFFRPAMYVAWAKRMGIDIPPQVSTQLDFVERERRGEIDPLDLFEAIKFGRKPRYIPSEGESETEAMNKKNRGPARRVENNSTRIILAILKASGLHKKNVSDVTDRIEKALREIADEMKDDFFLKGVERQTIRSRLEAALDLLK